MALEGVRLSRRPWERRSHTGEHCDPAKALHLLHEDASKLLHGFFLLWKSTEVHLNNILSLSMAFLSRISVTSSPEILHGKFHKYTIHFELCLVLNSMMRSCTSQLWPTWNMNHLSCPAYLPCICYSPISHFIARLTVVTLQSFCHITFILL